MRTLIGGLMLALAATEAAAGAWPRPKGETFVSIATRQSTGARTLIAAVQDIESYNSIYVEHGLTDRLTVGLDAGRATGPDETVDAALVFARLPIVKKLIDYCRRRGIQQLNGDALAENRPVIALAQRYGGKVSHAERGTVTVTVDLTAPLAA